MQELDNASVQHRCRCGCAIVDGYRCGNEGGQLQVKVLHPHRGIATHGAVLRWWRNFRLRPVDT